MLSVYIVMIQDSQCRKIENVQSEKLVSCSKREWAVKSIHSEKRVNERSSEPESVKRR